MGYQECLLSIDVDDLIPRRKRRDSPDDVQGPRVANMRLREVTGVGARVLNHTRPLLPATFSSRNGASICQVTCPFESDSVHGVAPDVGEAVVTPDPQGVMAEDEAPHIGLVLGGRYQVVELIGRGGMGLVYKAVHTSIVDRAVAVKFLRPHLAVSLDHVDRFQNEIRVVSQLKHPNTIRVYDYGTTEENQLYLITELLEGESLTQILDDRGRLAPRRSVRIVGQVLRSLGEAHAHGIVHRDIKPDNIFVDHVHGEVDFVKILDFGIARVAGAADSAKGRTCVVAGTPAYVSPEAAQGFPLDTRSDIYSVGVLLYRMLTGRLPFQENDPEDMLLAHVIDNFPSVRSLAPDVPPALEAVVHACLAKTPEHRPQTAEVLQHELEAALQEEGRPERPVVHGMDAVPPRLRRRSSASRQGVGIAPQISSLDHTPDIAAEVVVATTRPSEPAAAPWPAPWPELESGDFQDALDHDPLDAVVLEEELTAWERASVRRFGALGWMTTVAGAVCLFGWLVA